MSFIEFLLEYYIYILAVLIILIIGVIGFLVDSNNKDKNKKKKEDNSKEVKRTNDVVLTNNVMNNEEPLEPTQIQNNMPVNNTQNDMQMPQMVNNSAEVVGLENINTSDEVNNAMTNLDSNLNSSMQDNTEVSGINNINQSNGLNGQFSNKVISQPVDTNFSVGMPNSIDVNNNSMNNIQPVMPDLGINPSVPVNNDNSLVNNINQNMVMSNISNEQVSNGMMNKSVNVNSGMEMLNSFDFGNNMNNAGNMQSNVNLGVPISSVMGTPVNVNQNTAMNGGLNDQMAMSSFSLNTIPNQMGQSYVNSNGVNQVSVGNVNYNDNNLYNNNQMNSGQMMMQQNSVNLNNVPPVNNMGMNFNSQPHAVNVDDVGMNQATMVNNGQNGGVAGMNGVQNTYSDSNVVNANLQNNGQVFTSVDSKPFDISSMFLNNK